MTSRRGFTIVELMTVMVISAILLGLIAVPLIQGFNLTRAAQAFADAQDRARTLISQIEREIGNSAGVRDNTGYRGAVDVLVPGFAAGTTERIRLANVKLDILAPAQGDPVRGPGGAFINPETGKEDPTLGAPKGQPVLPATAGVTIIRYFVGLRDPSLPYNNPHDAVLGGPVSGRDNLYVMYRAEVSPYILRDHDGNPGTPLEYVVDTRYFVDGDRDADPDTRGPVFDDPSFFDPSVVLPPYAAPRPYDPGSKNEMVTAWLNRATIVTELSRYDMIMPVVDRDTGRPVYDGNVPQIIPLVRFQPTRVSSEPANGMVALRSGEETDNAAKVGPDVYATQYGAWSAVQMRIWPSVYPTVWGLGPGEATAGAVRERWQEGTPFLEARERYDATDRPLGLMLYGNDGTELFDIALYLDLAEREFTDPTAAYPFTQALMAGATAAPWDTRFVPCFPDPRSGKVVASFPIQQVGADAAAPYDDYDNRVPTAPVSPFPAPGSAPLDYTPNNDPDVGSGVWSDAIFQNVNRLFNKLWTDFPVLAPGLDRAKYVKRFVYLANYDQPGGIDSPLARTPGFQRAYVVPGSEVVIGPDQRPGPNYGRYVQYKRVSQGPVGVNQYKINYVDQPEPDYASLGFVLPPDPYNPETFDATNLVSAVIQPQYRAGYIELNSRFGEPIPSGYEDPPGSGTYVATGNILVSYRFQFTEPNDAVAVDYDSGELMEVVLTIRNYPQTTVPNVQSVTVRGSSAVRNFIR